MNKIHSSKKLFYFLMSLTILLTGFLYFKADANAAPFPNIAVSFDPTDQSVIVEGIPEFDSTGYTQYELNGYLNYGSERVETFCYAPSVRPHDVPERQAYIFNWADIEFILPCSGDYTFTTYVKNITTDPATGVITEEKGPKISINITLTKKDESTNWGPGLPNTTLEIYDLEQIKGKDKELRIEEENYTWIINGNDIETVPEKNLSLEITPNPSGFQVQGVDDFFGDIILTKFSIEHDGEFGFVASLNYYLGTENVGKYANLFYVVGDGTFEFRQSSMIDEHGMAYFNFNHASDYIIAITDTEYTGQDLNPKPIEPEITEPAVNGSAATDSTTDDYSADDTATDESSTDAPTVGDTTTDQISTDGATTNDASSVDTESDTPQNKSSVTTNEDSGNSNPFIWIIIGISALILIGIISTIIILRRNKTKMS